MLFTSGVIQYTDLIHMDISVKRVFRASNAIYLVMVS